MRPLRDRRRVSKASGVKTALVSLAGAALLSLQGATFVYVLDVQQRLTRLETLQGIGLPARPRRQGEPERATAAR